LNKTAGSDYMRVRLKAAHTYSQLNRKWRWWWVACDIVMSTLCSEHTTHQRDNSTMLCTA